MADGPPGFDMLKILDYAWAAVLAVAGIFWKKIADMEKNAASKDDLKALAAKVELKADDAELTRQRNNIDALFNGQTAIRAELHHNHTAQMAALNTVATQVATLVGRLDK